MLHGQEGRGRFKAFALGSVVDWKTTYSRDGALFRYDISISDRDIRRVRISDEVPVVTGRVTARKSGEVRRV